jgi:putative ABC transport system permease protein
LELLQGRFLSPDDVDSARHVMVVNHTLSRQLFGAENSVGHYIKLVGCDRLPQPPRDCDFEIVGVSSDYRNAGIRNPVAPQVFVPYTFSGVVMDRTILVRTVLPATSVLKAMRREVSVVDSDVGFRESGTVESYLKGLFQERQFELVTVWAFAATGLLLVLIGVFSVTAYTVSLKTHDIGIRIALGAQPGEILRMVLVDGLSTIIVGAAVGIAASLGLTRSLASRIWGVSPTDPWTFSAVVATIIVAGVAACLLPARRAMRVDPMIVLRHE